MTVELNIRIASSLTEIPAAVWDACAGAPSTELSTRGQPPNPFVSHAFLSSLEQSKSVGARTGWQPQHLIAETADGEVLGVAPCYAKSHSQGEYVFDHGWAEAFERVGGDYYPKLQVAVPFTPVTGPRLLARPGPVADSVRGALGDALAQVTKANGLSSAHVTFLTKEEWDLLGHRGYLQRTDQQFHWENEGYATFEDFLAALNSRKRKTIRRERKDALAPGITLHWLTGSDLTEEVWDAFFEFYMDTGSRKWGRPYLTRAFFSIVGAAMADRILLVMAKRAGRFVAGAINFIGDDTLYGRNWGAVEHHPFLHFEVCYYQAIEFAIVNKLKRVEAGAQGEHKLARGYLPHPTYSAHYIAHAGLRRAIDDYLARERAYVEAVGEELAAAGPFRKDLVEQD
ncbi:MAG TPA: GNAT family N-acetyltransferase [Pseudolabrys sp.]|uniref:GNAT family N-acetyltransferase n=1 Tax=Pseudolabrys sp. TaxID=1960880 RepID=UPI002DDD375E|nr:GNAT family N-acetyltransferase [Pseudolabrys sp.]HEV2630596.1 GNAT family N-acetyltransferase [Pseudolabrys sp.]